MFTQVSRVDVSLHTFGWLSQTVRIVMAPDGRTVRHSPLFIAAMAENMNIIFWHE